MNEFSIVTPSYNMLSFLKACAASIADQQDVSLEHIVIDCLSTDGTVEWLKNNPNIKIENNRHIQFFKKYFNQHSKIQFKQEKEFHIVASLRKKGSCDNF